MKIDLDQALKKVRLDDLRPGDVFLDGDQLCMKTDEFPEDDEDATRVVTLDGGVIRDFSDSHLVTPIDVTLIRTK